MLLLLAQAAQVCALRCKFPRAGKPVRCSLKSFQPVPTLSPAQGGITVALGNTHEDNWEWHMYDTVKGSDYIGDRMPLNICVKTGPEAILELEHMGLPFSRLDDGRIYQRPFGGQSKNFGGEQAARTAAAADRTGHALLHTLYQQNLKNHTTIFFRVVCAGSGEKPGMARWSAVLLCASKPVKLFTSKPAQRCWRPVAQAVFTSPPPTRISIPATASVWRYVQAYRCRTWKCGSSTRPVLRAQVCW
ncbi:hypothetical protein CWS02_18505 [Enterobacter sp. EA-1]|nr:hypothetical protein CWS02_18505 [Enterobacter sp. EA-1]